MSRTFARYPMLVIASLIPLAAGCGRSDQPKTTSAGATPDGLGRFDRPGRCRDSRRRHYRLVRERRVRLQRGALSRGGPALHRVYRNPCGEPLGALHAGDVRLEER